MADWVHCNKCIQKYRSSIKFFLAECGHVICDKCRGIMVSNDNKCVVCSKSVKCIVLSGEVPYDIQWYFKPLPTFMDAFKQIYDFQHKNELNLQKALINKYSYAKQEVLKSYNVINGLKKENNRLKNILKSIHPSSPPISGLATSTPMTGTFPNNSVLSSVARNSNFKFQMMTPESMVSNDDSIKHPGYARRVSFTRMDTMNTPSQASSPHQVVSSGFPKVHGRAEHRPPLCVQSFIGRRRPA